MKNYDCIVCKSKTTDRCHIKSRGSGGSDDEWNIFFACRFHHVQQHGIGVVAFVELYPEVKKEFEKKGWEIVNEFGVKKLRRKTDE